MAVPVRVVPAKPSIPNRPLKVAGQTVTPSVSASTLANLVLPTVKSAAITVLGVISWLIYGVKKIGKTSLAVHFPDSLLFCFEPGAKALEAFKVDIPSWAYFLKYIELLEREFKAGTLRFKTFIIDTGFEAYARCLEHVCKELGMKYPSEGKDRGIAWNQVSTEFRRAHNRLCALGMGMVILCHDKMIECETRAGQKFDMVVPKLQSQSDDYYRATVDNLVYYHYRDKERFLTIRGSDYMMAGVASETNFKTVDGIPVYAIPMGNSSEEAYQNVIDAFNNLQNESFEEESKRFEDEALAASMRKKLKEKQDKPARR